MSLNLKISVTEENNSFVVYDCTGLFSASNNPGGWGSQTFKLSDLTAATLEITPPNALAPISINVYPDFPNGNSKIGYEILPYVVNMKEIESGLWNIKLTVSGTTSLGVQFTRVAFCSEIFMESVFCCVDKWQKDLTTECFRSERQKQIILMNNLVESVKYNCECGLNNKASTIIEFLKGNCICVGC